MRIAFLIYSLSGGGAEHMITRLANGMVKRGIYVDIILFDPAIIKYELDPRVSIVSAQVGGNGIKRDIRRVGKIRRYIIEKNPDILCCFILTSLPYAVAANLFRKTKIVGAERGNPNAHTEKDRIRMRITMPFCDGYIFQTKGAKDYYNNRVKCKSAIIGNIAPKYRETAVMQSGIAKDICTAGRLCRQKGFETLLKAFARVVKQIPDAKLHIYGEGHERNNLISYTQRLHISDRVIFEGFCNDMSREYLKYEVFVLSSKSEGMPNVLLEAMAAGMACISSDCDFGPSELIDDGKNGMLVPIEDEAALSDALLLVMLDKDKRAAFGSEAAKISEKYSEDEIVTKYIKFSNCVIRGGV